ncbi:MAG: DUF3313 domain-containing protein [Planctomycetota bacterium]
MKWTNVLMIVAVGLMLILCGCGSKSAAKVGFLSDYSRLQAESDTVLLYISNTAIGRYSSFIVDPVEVHLHSGSKSKGKLTEEQISDLTGYTHSRILEAVRGAGKKIAYRPAPGVARMRVALTDLKKSTAALNIIPQTKLTGVGLGAASMEGEIVDSMTGQQVAAIVQSQSGNRLSLDGVSKWGDAKAIIDDWGKDLQEILQEAR